MCSPAHLHSTLAPLSAQMARARIQHTCPAPPPHLYLRKLHCSHAHTHSWLSLPMTGSVFVCMWPRLPHNLLQVDSSTRCVDSTLHTCPAPQPTLALALFPHPHPHPQLPPQLCPWLALPPLSLALMPCGLQDHHHTSHMHAFLDTHAY